MEVARLMKRLDIDIVHTVLIQSDIIGALATKLVRVRALVSSVEGNLAGDLPSGSRVRNTVRRIVYKYGYQLASRYIDCVIANSEATRAQLVASFPCVEEKVRVLYPGLELERFNNEPTKGDRSRPRPTIGFLGELTPEKGADVLVAAAKEVIRHIPNARFIIGGQGSEEKRLKQIATKAGLADAILFLGFVFDDAAFYEELSAFAFPSLPGFDGLPMVVLQALAQGVPTVASRVGGVPEVIQPGVTGWLVQPGRPDELADGILQILENPLEASRRAMAAKERIISTFSIQAEVDSLQDIYEELTM
jgi:glycosyltransferase involved in cell wall biosynthesis